MRPESVCLRKESRTALGTFFSFSHAVANTHSWRSKEKSLSMVSWMDRGQAYMNAKKVSREREKTKMCTRHGRTAGEGTMRLIFTPGCDVWDLISPYVYAFKACMFFFFLAFSVARLEARQTNFFEEIDSVCCFHSRKETTTKFYYVLLLRNFFLPLNKLSHGAKSQRTTRDMNILCTTYFSPRHLR